MVFLFLYSFASTPKTYKYTSVLARDMVHELDHPTCGPMKLVNTPVKYSHAKPGIRTAPPTLGQHTNEVLTDLGFSKGEVMELRGNGVVA